MLQDDIPFDIWIEMVLEMLDARDLIQVTTIIAVDWPAGVVFSAKRPLTRLELDWFAEQKLEVDLLAQRMITMPTITFDRRTCVGTPGRSVELDVHRLVIADDTRLRYVAKECTAPLLVIIGPPGAGKTMLAHDIMHHFQDVPHGLVVAGREADQDGYKRMMSTNGTTGGVFGEYTAALAEPLFRRQIQVIRTYYNNKNTGPDPRVFMLLDDCIINDFWSRDKIMRCAFMNGRSWKVMRLIAMRFPLGVPPVLRYNIDFAFMFATPCIKERRRMYENYASVFPSFEMFNAAFDQLAVGYECMVVRYHASSNRLEDLVQFYRAQVRAPLLGSCHGDDASDR